MSNKTKTINSIISSVNDTMYYMNNPVQENLKLINNLNQQLTNRTCDFFSDDYFDKIKEIVSLRNNLKKKKNPLTHSTSFKKKKTEFANNILSKSNSVLNLKNKSLPSLNNIKTNNMNDIFFCPKCPHCLKKNDNDALKKYLFNLKEAKNILIKGCSYIIENASIDQINNIFNFSDPDLILLSEEEEEKKNKFEKEKKIFDFREFLKNYQNDNNFFPLKREIYLLLSNYLNLLLDGNLNIETIIPKHIMDKFNDKLIAKGQLFDFKSDKLIFDPDVESLIDGKTKETITQLFKKSFLKPLIEEKKENKENYIKSSKKYLILFFIFLQELGEISIEFKEKSNLLYKLFINFFVEQDKKWILTINKMKEKLNLYKNISKIILSQKNKNIESIESLTTILYTNKLTKENLDNHKETINKLLSMINEKREEVYQLEAKVSILKHELNFWLEDFEEIKLDKNLRLKKEKLNIEEMRKNVFDELKHKNVSSKIRSLVLNSDILLTLSGQRNYFYDTKKFYINETRRITELLNHQQMRKKFYKNLLKKHSINYENEKRELKQNIDFLKAKMDVSKNDILIQTDIDYYKFNKLIKNNNIIIMNKRLTSSKLINIVEKINYNTKFIQPLGKQSLLNLIPDLYRSKAKDNIIKENENLPKINFDEFFLLFMKEKFKLQKIVKKNAEKTIKAVLLYEKEDQRIFLFKRFLGLHNKDKVIREVFDIYLILLQNLPISFDKLFYETNYLSFIMDTNFCFECIHACLNFYQILNKVSDIIIIHSTVYEQSSKNIITLSGDKKRDYFYLLRLNEKSIIFFNKLINDLKQNIREKDIEPIITYLHNSNLIFKLSRDDCYNILKRNFKINDNNTIDLDSFLEFFVNKLTYKIQIYDFCDIIFNAIQFIFDGITKKCKKIFTEIRLGSGIIFYKDFEKIIFKLIRNGEIKWKISNYFNEACGADTRDYISQEEFISFVMNNNDILSFIIQQNDSDIFPSSEQIQSKTTSSSFSYSHFTRKSSSKTQLESVFETNEDNNF